MPGSSSLAGRSDVALAALRVAAVGTAAVGAGLVPIATGYVAGHHLTFVPIDGHKILIALGDPFPQGWKLAGLGRSIVAVKPGG